MSNINEEVFGKIITEPEKDAKTVNDVTDEVFGKIGDSKAIYAPVDLSGQYGRGDSQFDSYSEPVELLDNLNTVRAERQPFLHQAFNATIGGLGSGLLTAGESLSLLLDIPNNISAAKDYFSNEEQVNTIESNAFSDFFKDTKESLLNEYMPIYRKNPDKITDFNDTGFYWETFRGIVDSGVGFGLSGMGVGAGVKLAGKALRLARMGNYTGKVSQALNTVGKGLQQGRAGQITTGYLTNHAENKIMALELYESSQDELYNQYIEQYKEDNNEAPSESELKEFRLDAKINAGKQANSFLLRGKAFAFVDILQLNRMFKPASTMSRNALKEPSFKNFLKDQFKPSSMAKESAEEIGQNTLQKELEFQARKDMMDSGYSLPDKDVDDMSFMERMFTFATSEQALLEGAMGALGGPIQYSVTQLPFENFKTKREQYTSQTTQFGKNEDYLKNTLFKELVKEKNNEEASQTLEDKANEDKLGQSFKQNQDELTFINMALKNFALGTTAQFEQELQSLMNREDVSQEEKKSFQKYQDLLTELERDYNNNNRKYAAGTVITSLNGQVRYNDNNVKTLEESRANLVAKLDKHVKNYNKVSDSNHSVHTVLNNLQDTSQVFQDYIKGYPDLVETIQTHDQYIKKIQSNSNTLLSDIEGLKKDNAVFEAFKEVDKPNVDTEEKIKAFKELVKQARFKSTKDYIKRRIEQYQKELIKVQKNETIEKEGGSEELRNKAKKSSKTKVPKGLDEQFGVDPNADIDANIPSNIDEHIEFNEQTLNEGDLDKFIDSNKLESLVAEAIQKGEDADETVENYLKSLENLPPEGQETVDKFLDNFNLKDIDAQVTAQAEGALEQDIPAEAIDNFEEPNEVPDVTTEVEPIPLESKKPNEEKTSPDIDTSNNLIKSSKNQSDLNGIKLAFRGKDLSEGYKKYLADNRNKTGDAVEFTVNTEYLNSKLPNIKELYDYARNNPNEKFPKDLIDKLPIKVTFNNDSSITTNLFPVKLPNKIEEGKEYAFQFERKLRSQILNNILNGKKATSTVNYQYSGAFQSDGQFKSVYRVNQLSNPDAIKFLYTDSQGQLRNDENRLYDETKSIRLKEQGVAYKGQIFALVDSANGEVPLKLNNRKLNENEIRALEKLFLYITDPANAGKDKDNALRTKITDKSLEKIYELIPAADREYLGTSATVGEVLSHLIHEGKFTSPDSNGKANPVTQLYFNKGNLVFSQTVKGKSFSVTNEQLKKPEVAAKLRKFLKLYKNRNINYDKLNNDRKYRKLVLDNQILNTDVEVDKNKNPFQSINTGKQEDRYKTKSIYVKTELDNLEKTPIVETEETSNILSVSDIEELFIKKGVIDRPIGDGFGTQRSMLNAYWNLVDKYHIIGSVSLGSIGQVLKEGKYTDKNLRQAFINLIEDDYTIDKLFEKIDKGWKLEGRLPEKETSTKPKIQGTQSTTVEDKNIFNVKPIQSADKKAKSKAKIATQFIGFAEGITGSSTSLYAKQAGKYANTGNYNSNDTIFVSVPGKRGEPKLRKQQQDKTIKEAIKALEEGATLITDNKGYINSSSYNEGEKRLYSNLEVKGYKYSEITIDNNLLGVWKKDIDNKPTQSVAKSEKSTNLAENKVKEEMNNAKKINKTDISKSKVQAIRDNLANKQNQLKDLANKINKPGNCNK